MIHAISSLMAWFDAAHPAIQAVVLVLLTVVAVLAFVAIGCALEVGRDVMSRRRAGVR